MGGKEQTMEIHFVVRERGMAGVWVAGRWGGDGRGGRGGGGAKRI